MVVIQVDSQNISNSIYALAHRLETSAVTKIHEELYKGIDGILEGLGVDPKAPPPIPAVQSALSPNDPKERPLIDGPIEPASDDDSDNSNQQTKTSTTNKPTKTREKTASTPKTPKTTKPKQKNQRTKTQAAAKAAASTVNTEPTSNKPPSPPSGTKPLPVPPPGESNPVPTKRLETAKGVSKIDRTDIEDALGLTHLECCKFRAAIRRELSDTYGILLGVQTFGKYSEKEQTGMERVVFLQWKELYPDRIKQMTPTIAQRILFNMFRDKYRNNRARKPAGTEKTTKQPKPKPIKPATSRSKDQPVVEEGLTVPRARENGTTGGKKKKSKPVVDSGADDFVFDPTSIGQSVERNSSFIEDPEPTGISISIAGGFEEKCDLVVPVWATQSLVAFQQWARRHLQRWLVGQRKGHDLVCLLGDRWYRLMNESQLRRFESFAREKKHRSIIVDVIDPETTVLSPDDKDSPCRVSAIRVPVPVDEPRTGNSPSVVSESSNRAVAEVMSPPATVPATQIQAPSPLQFARPSPDTSSDETIGDTIVGRDKSLVPFNLPANSILSPPPPGHTRYSVERDLIGIRETQRRLDKERLEMESILFEPAPKPRPALAPSEVQVPSSTPAKPTIEPARPAPTQSTHATSSTATPSKTAPKQSTQAPSSTATPSEAAPKQSTQAPSSTATPSKTAPKQSTQAPSSTATPSKTAPKQSAQAPSSTATPSKTAPKQSTQAPSLTAAIPSVQAQAPQSTAKTPTIAPTPAIVKIFSSHATHKAKSSTTALEPAEIVQIPSSTPTEPSVQPQPDPPTSTTAPKPSTQAPQASSAAKPSSKARTAQTRSTKVPSSKQSHAPTSGKPTLPKKRGSEPRVKQVVATGGPITLPVSGNGSGRLPSPELGEPRRSLIVKLKIPNTRLLSIGNVKGDSGHKPAPVRAPTERRVLIRSSEATADDMPIPTQSCLPLVPVAAVPQMKNRRSSPLTPYPHMVSKSVHVGASDCRFGADGYTGATNQYNYGQFLPIGRGHVPKSLPFKLIRPTTNEIGGVSTGGVRKAPVELVETSFGLRARVVQNSVSTAVPAPVGGRGQMSLSQIRKQSLAEKAKIAQAEKEEKQARFAASMANKRRRVS